MSLRTDRANAGPTAWRSASTLFKIAVTVGTLFFVLRNIDITDAGERIRSGNRVLLLAALLILSLQPLISVLRWKLVLKANRANVDVGSIARWTYVATFIGQVLPATVGADAVRSWLCARAGSPWKVAIASVALDRLAMLLCLVLLVACAAPWLGKVMAVSVPVYLMLVLLVGGACAVAALLMAELIPSSLDRYRVVRTARFLSAQARVLFLTPSMSVGLFALCIVSFLNLILSLYVCALAFDSNVHLRDFLILIPLVLIASSVPISMGGWGTREFAMVAVLGTVGIEPETAVLVSVLFGIGSILVSLPGAIFYLSGPASTWRDVDHAEY